MIKIKNIKVPNIQISSNVFENMKIIIDKTQDNYVLENHYIRMVIYHTQKIRKTLGLRPWNVIRFYYNTEDDNLMTILKKRVDTLKKELSYDVVFDENQLDKLTAAKRSNCILNTKKLSALGFSMTPSAQALQSCMSNYIKNI